MGIIHSIKSDMSSRPWYNYITNKNNNTNTDIHMLVIHMVLHIAFIPKYQSTKSTFDFERPLCQVQLCGVLSFMGSFMNFFEQSNRTLCTVYLSLSSNSITIDRGIKYQTDESPA